MTISRKELKFRVNVQDIHNISVTWNGSGFETNTLAMRGIAEASFIGEWWVNRVLIQPKSFRGMGIGGHMLNCLLENIENRGGRQVFVSPGGYDNNISLQTHFYLAHGFKQVEPGLLRWRSERST